MTKPIFWRWDSKTGRLARQERLSSGFSFDKVEFERKPWISWLMAPFVNTLTVYVWLKKKWWQRFKGKNPPVNTMWFDGLGKYSRICKQGHGNWESLKVLYLFHKQKKYTISWFIDQMGFYNSNAQAVRNRLKVTRAISEQFIKKNKSRSILCLACGSAESLLPAYQQINANGHQLTLVDNDCDVIKFLEEEHCCSRKDRLKVIHAQADEYLDRLESKNNFDLIEIIGALEYMDDSQASATIGKCLKALKPFGVLVTSNIRRNSESSNVKWMLGWDMYYRSLDNFIRILKGGGGLDGLEIVTEPLGIHNIAIFRKNPGEMP